MSASIVVTQLVTQLVRRGRETFSKHFLHYGAVSRSLAVTVDEDA